jgi:hypothetical protein
MSAIETRPITDRASWLDWRGEDITASVAACLFGDDVHPYTSAYQQWSVKTGLWTPKPIDPRLARRGAVIEKIAPDILAEERPDWKIFPNGLYYRDPDARIGATPDLTAFRPDVEGRGTIDVKSVGAQAFRKWKDRDTGETALPLWIAIQVNIQAALMDAAWGAVAPITIGDAGLDVEIIDVPIRPEVMESFRLHAREFWRRVREKDPYPIDWGKDAATILDIYGDDDGSIVDLTDDSMAKVILLQREDFKRLEAEGSEAEKRRKVLDAQLIHLMGNAKSARVGSALIKAPTVRVKEAMRKAYSFRRITVTGYEHSPADPDGAE